MSATIRPFERSYCMWSGCEAGAHWVVYESHEPVGEFCLRHARAEANAIERRLADTREGPDE